MVTQSGLGWLVGGGEFGSLPPPGGSSFASRILHLLSCHPPHQSARHQEAVPELSAGSKRLRKQVRRNWSRTESRWRMGSRRQAEGCREEPAGTRGQHFSACGPAGHRRTKHSPCSSPAPHFPRLCPPFQEVQPGEKLCPEQEPKQPAA